jgi:hypothetical protein
MTRAKKAAYATPAYTLFIASRCNAKDKTKAGVAFPNEFGGLNLRLNPGVVVRWNDDVFFNLNPYESPAATARRYGRKPVGADDNLDEELFGDPPGGDELGDKEDADLEELVPDEE